MVKKLKGGERKDKFYHLARETGYRSRAAFKLIQLNRRYHFLENSRVCIDLCAAPGSWLQVAQKNMPVSSMIIGVDLDPIKSIPNVASFRQDITTPECISALKKHLQSNKADLILNDGAPNVGTSWQQDAFNQVRLGLYGLKIAVEFLSAGGCLVTKVFRSNDYPKLLSKFREFFGKVTSTKPSASRTESAEIYVVCQNYKPLKKSERSSLNPNVVFAHDVAHDVTNDQKRSISLNRLQKPTINRQGYEDGATILHKAVKLTEFLKIDDYMSVLGSSNEITIDSEYLREHCETTEDIIEYCKDLKLLGKSEMKQLLRWRKCLIKDLNEKKRMEETQVVFEIEEISEKMDQDESDAKNLVDLVDKISNQKVREEKMKFKKERKKIISENKRINKKMTFKNDYFDQTDGLELFSLKTLPEEVMRKIDADDILDESLINSETDSIASTNYTVDDMSQIDSEDDEDILSQKDEEIIHEEEMEDTAVEEDGLTPSEKESSAFDVPRKAKIDSSGYHDFRLDACEKALARELIKSKKRRREIEELGFNRFSYDDDGIDLPNWFIEDEKKHRRIIMPVTREQVALERERDRAMNARPPKKVLEAKIRRKKKLAAKLEIARKKADSLGETDDITVAEKNRQIKEIYRKSGIFNRKKEKTTLVPVKRGAGKRASRPHGVRGKYKLVDRKMKSDKGAKRQKKKRDRPKKHFRR